MNFIDKKDLAFAEETLQRLALQLCHSELLVTHRVREMLDTYDVNSIEELPEEEQEKLNRMINAYEVAEDKRDKISALIKDSVGLITMEFDRGDNTTLEIMYDPDKNAVFTESIVDSVTGEVTHLWIRDGYHYNPEFKIRKVIKEIING